MKKVSKILCKLGCSALLLSAASQVKADQETVEINVGEATLSVTADWQLYDLSAAEMQGWVSEAAQIVAQYYGQFPSKETHLFLQARPGVGVQGGNAYGFKTPRVNVRVGRDSTLEHLDHDWILIHELIHLAMADLPDEHHWLEEGISTYVESIARVQSGDLTEQEIWFGMVQGMPHGLPAAGDNGLDRTPTWGRTYWGGALFCLLTDIRYRQQSDLQVGLQQALRGMVQEGVSIAMELPMNDIVEMAGHATSLSAFAEQYEAMKHDPYWVDLPTLWRDLGIRVDGSAVSFDNNAPLAALRQSITKSQ